jgi:hypothetical protein
MCTIKDSLFFARDRWLMHSSFPKKIRSQSTPMPLFSRFIKFNRLLMNEVFGFFLASNSMTSKLNNPNVNPEKIADNNKSPENKTNLAHKGINKTVLKFLS